MALSSWDFKRNEELFDDELVMEALTLLEKRYDKMANWLKENSDYTQCKECGNEDFNYKHNGIECNNCSYFEKVQVPCPAKGGTVASRKLESVIKELFSLRMAEKRKEDKPTEKDLRELDFSVSKFDTGEYTPSEIKFLKDRFKTIVEENRISNSVDEFYIRSLVQQELKIMQMARKEAVGQPVKSSDKKKEYDIYNKLASKVKASKDSRDNQEEESVLEKLSAEGAKIEDDLQNFFSQLEDRESKIDKSKQRMKESGNELVE